MSFVHGNLQKEFIIQKVSSTCYQVSSDLLNTRTSYEHDTDSLRVHCCDCNKTSNSLTFVKEDHLFL